MARVGHEAPLAGQALLEPAEHVVERLAEPVDLITRAREREAPAGRVPRDLGGLTAHRLDRPQGGRRKEIAGAGRKEQGEWADDEQLGEQLVERLVAVLERRADHERRGHEQAHRLAADFTREEEGAVLRARRLLGGHERSVEPGRRGGRRAVRAEPLGDCLVVARFQRAATREGLRPHLEALVELFVERVAEPNVEKGADRDEHEGHRYGEGEREAQADRQAAHESSRSR